MTWKTVFDPAFAPFGRVLEGMNCEALLRALRDTEKPENAVRYVPSHPPLEDGPEAAWLSSSVYGGMPIQIGYCNGSNTVLNCLEYHRDSEINIPADDTVLLVARQQDMDGGTLDTAKVEAFLAPAGTVVELYATTLHYAPCDGARGQGFRVAVVLPRGTNMGRPEFTASRAEDSLLRARNKWLIAHPDAPEAKDGAHVGLLGENIDIIKHLTTGGKHHV